MQNDDPTLTAMLDASYNEAIARNARNGTQEAPGLTKGDSDVSSHPLPPGYHVEHVGNEAILTLPNGSRHLFGGKRIERGVVVGTATIAQASAAAHEAAKLHFDYHRRYPRGAQLSLTPTGHATGLTQEDVL